MIELEHTVRITQGRIDHIDAARRIGKEYEADGGFVWDLFRLFESGDGPLSVERIRKDILPVAWKKVSAARGKAADAVHVYRALLTRRRALNKLACSKSFPHLRRLDPEMCVEKFLHMLKELKPHIQQEYCRDCHLRPDCAFGKEMVRTGRLSTKEIHEACPYHAKDEMTQWDSMLDALVDQMRLLEDEVMGPVLQEIAKQKPDWLDAGADVDTGQWVGVIGSGEKTPPLQNRYMPLGGISAAPSTFTGQQTLDTLEKFVSKLAAQNFKLWNIARKIWSAWSKGEDSEISDKWKDGSDHLVRVGVDSLEDAHRVDARGRTDDEVDLAIITGDAVCVDSRSPKPRRQVVFCLTDCSGSMSSLCQGYSEGSNATGVVTNAQLAALVMTSFLRKIEQNGGVGHHAFFAYGITSEHTAETAEEYAHIYQRIARCDATGGGTEIMRALNQAVDRIEATKTRLTANTKQRLICDADILIVTDMGSTMEKGAVEKLGKRLQKNSIKLYCIDLQDAVGGDSKTRSPLESVSESYKHIQSAHDLDQIVNDLREEAVR